VRRALAPALVAAIAAGAVLVTGVAGADRFPEPPVETAYWFPRRSSTIARQEVAAARIGRYVYVVGGFAGSSPSAAVERYDTARDKWTQVAPMPVALNHTAAVAYRNRLYVVDGYIGDEGTLGRSNGLTVAILLRYDPARDAWTELSAPPTRRGAAAAAVVGDRLYVAGGVSSTEGELKRLEIYDFARRRWRSGPDMGEAREHVSGAASGGAFYVIGGRRDPITATGNTRTVERFDPAAGRWRRAPDLIFPRSGAGAATVHGRIVVFGGEDFDSMIETAEVLDPRIGRWRRLPDMATPRHSLGAASSGSRVYAIEGSPTPRAGASSTLEALDLPLPTRPRLRLAVHPRRVIAGRRVRFAFRVTIRGRGRLPVRGARVRFAGAVARTGRRGRATLTRRLGRPGRYVARVRKHGTRLGLATVTVVPKAARPEQEGR
jgi:Kelch motif protein